MYKIINSVIKKKEKNPLDHISLSHMYCTNMILSEQKCAKKKTHSESKLATLEQLNQNS